MTDSSNDVSKALFESLIAAPPLIGDLPEGAIFENLSLVFPTNARPLNLQQKLGHLYEDAFAVMLESTPRYDLLERGIQIRKEAGHTLGELDFLLRDLRASRLIHLELAVKFYLAVESKNGFLLPGPDARDNYFRKLEKMRSHQLLLARKYRDLLPEKFRTKEIVVQQVVQGCIFNHVNASKPVEAEFLNPNGRRGKWLRADEVARYFGKDVLLEIIPKPLWPVPLELLDGLELEKWTLDEDLDRCVMVRAASENLPYFIVPHGYPKREDGCPRNTFLTVQQPHRSVAKSRCRLSRCSYLAVKPVHGTRGTQKHEWAPPSPEDSLRDPLRDLGGSAFRFENDFRKTVWAWRSKSTFRLPARTVPAHDWRRVAPEARLQVSGQHRFLTRFGFNFA